MSARIDHGRYSWRLSTDAEGYRTYHLTTYVSTDSPLDGPLIARGCAGLPQPGSTWAFGNEFDDWVWCRWENDVTSLQDGEPCQEWRVVQQFSNRPIKDWRCNSTNINDPLLEPMKISGSFNKYTEEATFDRFGLPIVTSSWEQIRGPQVEFDANRTTVCVEQNVASLQLPLLDAIKNCVNDAPLWGMPRRCVKLSSMTWSRHYHGQCYPYFIRRFEFDVNARIDPVSGAIVSGFDRDILDEGSKALHGGYDNRVGIGGGDWVLRKIAGVFMPDPYNPTHFDQYRDRKGDLGRVLLNGLGLPAGVKVRGGKSLYMSLTGTHTANDIGDTTKWLKLTTDPANRPTWAAGNWSQGSLVNYNAGGGVEIFLCTSSTGSTGTPAVTPGVARVGWLLIAAVTDKGDYDFGPTYAEGDYVAQEVATGPLSMSRVNAAAHTPQDITDPAKWVKLKTPPSAPITFVPGSNTAYLLGTLVVIDGAVFLCIAGSSEDPRSDTVGWLQVTPNAKGAYDGTANYNVGDYVTPAVNATLLTTQGRIHVEKYDEANLLLLGIPTILA